MKKLLFFNRFPIIDRFITEMISNKPLEVTIVRTIPDLSGQFKRSKFDYILMNVDDRLIETPYIKELSTSRYRRIKVILFDEYKDQLQALRRAGVRVFLPDEPLREDFEMALQ